MVFRLMSPCKLFAEDLKSCERRQNLWCLQIKHQTFHSALVLFEEVWLQGYVRKTSENNTFTLNDGTGQVAIKFTNTTQGDLLWIEEGGACLVLGSLLHVNPPTIEALKLGRLQDPLLAESWKMEVREAKCVLAKPPTQL